MSKKEKQDLQAKIDGLNVLVNDLYKRQDLILEHLKLEVDIIPPEPPKPCKSVLVKMGTIAKRNYENALKQKALMNQLANQLQFQGQ